MTQRRRVSRRRRAAFAAAGLAVSVASATPGPVVPTPVALPMPTTMLTWSNVRLTAEDVALVVPDWRVST